MANKIMHYLFLSCLKATELIEKRFHLELSFKEKLQLKMHTMMCDACTLYEKQSEIIEDEIQKHFHEKPPEATDTEKLEEQIKLELEKSKQ